MTGPPRSETSLRSSSRRYEKHTQLVSSVLFRGKRQSCTHTHTHGLSLHVHVCADLLPSGASPLRAGEGGGVCRREEAPHEESSGGASGSRASLPLSALPQQRPTAAEWIRVSLRLPPGDFRVSLPDRSCGWRRTGSAKLIHISSVSFNRCVTLMLFWPQFKRIS